MSAARASRLGCAAALASLVFAGAAAAQPLAPKKPSDVVAVAFYTSGGSEVPCNGLLGGFAPTYISRPDGTTAPYSPPAKSVFVVTSIAFAGSGASPGATNITLVAVDPVNPPVAGALSFTFAGALSDAGGTYTGNMVLPTGFVIKPPALPCVLFPGTGAGNAVLHGFFAKDK
jgi:hypothetical protein